MKSAFYATNDSNLEFDPMLDIIAQEAEYQVVSDLHNGFLCTVEFEWFYADRRGFSIVRLAIPLLHLSYK